MSIRELKYDEYLHERAIRNDSRRVLSINTREIHPEMLLKRRTGSSIRLDYVIVIFLLFQSPLFSNLLPSSLSNGLFLLGFVLAGICFFRDRGIHFNFGLIGFHSMWILALFYICVSCILSPRRNLTELMILTLSIILMICSANSDRWLSSAARCMVGMLLVFAISTIFMYYSPAFENLIRNNIVHNNDNYRGYQSGITAHYSNNGLFNSIGSVVSYCYFIYSENRPKKCVWGAVFAIFFIALMLTGKRTGFVCVIAAIMIVYLTSAKSGKSLKLIAAILLAGYLALVFGAYIPGFGTVIERFGEALYSGSLEDSTSGRTLLWDFAIKGWLHKPILGNGWGSFYFIWPNGITVSAVAHNELLTLLYETGIAGTIIIVTCMLSSLVSTIKLIRNSNLGANGVFLRISLGIQVYSLIYGFTMGGILYSPTYFCFYLLSVAIMIVFYCRYTRDF